MNADRLFALYDRVAEAPGAVGRLRRFVLDLAVRGKLVEQDPSDEPAAELLKRMAAQKARLVKAGLIRKLKRIEVVDEPSYDLPSGWSFVALGDVIVKHLGGGTPSKSNGKYWGGSVRWASVKDVGKSKYLDDTIDRITEAGLENSSSNLIEPDNLLVVTRMGLGKVSINRVAVAINQDLRALILSDLLSVDYTYNFFLTHGFEGTGLTVKGIKLKELLSIPFPLPPLAEQHRIAAKVDELMAVCDQLEEARTVREDTRDRLTKASLTRLNAPDIDAPTFRSHARFAVDALPALTARADQIRHLRQTILGLAVRGKLVEPNPEEGSGQEVHARIKSARLSSPRPDKCRNPIQGMYALPSNWAWGQLGHVIVAGPRNGLSPRPSAREDAPRAVTLSATTSGTFDISHFKRVDAVIGPDSEFWLQPNDLLFQRGNTREYVGMAAIYDGPPGEFIFPDLMIRVRLSSEVSLRFVHLFCVSPAARNYFSENATGAQKTMPKINQAILRALPLPLPPLAEQHRIVGKVDELMVLCHRLEAGIGTADGTRHRLLDSLLHDVLASVAPALGHDRPTSGEAV